MPGLQGKDTTETEVADLQTIFQQHMDIERRVTNLTNVISTIIVSENPKVRAAIVSHVSMMVTPACGGQEPGGDHPIPHPYMRFLTSMTRLKPRSK